MNGGILKTVIIMPEKVPTAAHVAIAARLQKNMATGDAAKPPAATISVPGTTAESATKLPTDKSIPPATITIVIPTAMTAITTIWLATFSRFSANRNVGHK